MRLPLYPIGNGFSLVSDLNKSSRQSELLCIWLIALFFSASSFAATSTSGVMEPGFQSGYLELAEEGNSFDYPEFGLSSEIEQSELFDDDSKLFNASDFSQRISHDRIQFPSSRLSISEQFEIAFQSRAPPQI